MASRNRERPAAWAPAFCLSNIRQYRENAQREIARVKRNLAGLSDDDTASLVKKPEEQVQQMDQAVAANLQVLGKLEELIGRESQEAGGRCDKPPMGPKPVQSLLQTLVRHWSSEGLQERKECHDKLLGALDGHLKGSLEKAVASKAAVPRVVIPGVSVGRLAFEVQSRGYDVEACEHRLLLWYGMELIREHGSIAEALRPQPFAVNTCNRLRYKDNVRVTPMPDVAVKSENLPLQRFGHFSQLYGTIEARASFDCLLTEYSLDVSLNLFRFVRTIAHALRPGAVWANFGPLAYEADHDDTVGSGLELSWEELKYALSHFFEVQEEEWHDALYAQNSESLMQMQYTCIYFKAIRNNTPALGIGEDQSGYSAASPPTVAM